MFLLSTNCDILLLTSIFTEAIITVGKAQVANKMNNGWIPFNCFRVLLLFINDWSIQTPYVGKSSNTTVLCIQKISTQDIISKSYLKYQK